MRLSARSGQTIPQGPDSRAGAAADSPARCPSRHTSLPYPGNTILWTNGQLP